MNRILQRISDLEDEPWNLQFTFFIYLSNRFVQGRWCTNCHIYMSVEYTWPATGGILRVTRAPALGYTGGDDCLEEEEEERVFKFTFDFWRSCSEGSGIREGYIVGYLNGGLQSWKNMQHICSVNSKNTASIQPCAARIAYSKHVPESQEHLCCLKKIACARKTSPSRIQVTKSRSNVASWEKAPAGFGKTSPCPIHSTRIRNVLSARRKAAVAANKVSTA